MKTKKEFSQILISKHDLYDCLISRIIWLRSVKSFIEIFGQNPRGFYEKLRHKFETEKYCPNAIKANLTIFI